jgi:hypothetical protein
MRHYGASDRTIKRWRDETGIRLYDRDRDPVITRVVAQMPRDFPARAPHFSDRELGRQYGHGSKVIRRWREEAGIARTNVPPTRSRRPGGTNHHRIKLVPGQVSLPAFRNMTPALPGGREQDAAQHLRKHFPAVFRCDEAGRYDPKGSGWLVGAKVLTPAEMIAKAELKGWRADAWRELAA